MYCKTIRGEVVDSLGLPVPFSTIVVDHSQKIGTTNKYGRFVLEVTGGCRYQFSKT